MPRPPNFISSQKRPHEIDIPLEELSPNQIAPPDRARTTTNRVDRRPLLFGDIKQGSIFKLFGLLFLGPKI